MFTTVASVLHVVGMYEMNDLSDMAVKHIYYIWPPTLCKMSGQAFTQARLGAHLWHSHVPCSVPFFLS